jgi:hypothetical protein
MQISVTGMVWYSNAEDYDRLKAMFTDSDKLADTFDSWIKSAQTGFDKLTGAGHVVIKANIDPDTFPEWCRARGLEMNAHARTAFGNECAAEHYRSKMK